MLRKQRNVRKLAAEELFQYAAQLLGVRALSSAEVRTKLLSRAADPDDVETVLGRLAEYGFLDDTKFAEGYATARRDSGSFGRSRVLRDLRGRRVAAPVAQDAVQQVFEDFDEKVAIADWLQRKFRSVNLREYFADPKHLASAFRKLRYAGFSASSSISVLKQFASRADELEDEPEDS